MARKKINWSKVEKPKEFINYGSENLKVFISKAKIAKTRNGTDMVKYTIENPNDGKILFKKFYLTEDGLPYLKDFMEKIGVDLEKNDDPEDIVGVPFLIDTEVFESTDDAEKSFTVITSISKID